MLRANIDLPWLPDDDLVARMASANHQLAQLAARLGELEARRSCTPTTGSSPGPPTRCETLWDVPLVATIHATERGRHGGHVPQGTAGRRSTRSSGG